jgi:dCMP deaminase
MTDWNQRFLSLAEHIAQWSKDPSTQVGAVIVDPSRRIISTGYNGLPQGVDDTDNRLHTREIKYEMIVHGEINAILFAKQDLLGSTLYTWPFMPCSRCAGIVIQSGIKTVVAPLNDSPRWKDSFQLSQTMFAEAGVRLILL